MLNSIPSLRLDDGETGLLSGCWLDLLAIDDDTGKSTARPILCVLYAWAERVGRCIGNNSRIVAPTRACIPIVRPLSPIRTTLWDARLVWTIFALDAFKVRVQQAMLLPGVYVAAPVWAKKSIRVQPHEAFAFVLQVDRMNIRHE
ncbi:MAG: hypothetical protein WAK90_01445 [Pseudolabrys sp.]